MDALIILIKEFKYFILVLDGNGCGDWVKDIISVNCIQSPYCARQTQTENNYPYDPAKGRLPCLSSIVDATDAGILPKVVPCIPKDT